MSADESLASGAPAYRLYGRAFGRGPRRACRPM